MLLYGIVNTLEGFQKSNPADFVSPATLYITLRKPGHFIHMCRPVLAQGLRYLSFHGAVYVKTQRYNYFCKQTNSMLILPL